ncbi:MAG: CNNM domain-containing protein [Endomicrobium sp.]|jgi:CBS domain containing-hemolysin-like protein|nr:CNNM domain-containing protein [Endomicrobium sp.]
MFVFSWIIVLLILLLVSASISAAEIGITSLSKYRVKKLIVQYPKLSKSLFSWLKQPYYLLTIILTINVIADMLTSFFATDLLTHVFYMVNRNIVEFFSWFITCFTLLVFGEVWDEYDIREKTIAKLAYNKYIVQVYEYVATLNDELKINIPQGDYTTVNGWILNLFGRIPQVGETIDWNGYKIEIDDADFRRVNRIVLEKCTT